MYEMREIHGIDEICEIYGISDLSAAGPVFERHRPDFSAAGQISQRRRPNFLAPQARFNSAAGPIF